MRSDAGAAVGDPQFAPAGRAYVIERSAGRPRRDGGGGGGDGGGDGGDGGGGGGDGDGGGGDGGGDGGDGGDGGGAGAPQITSRCGGLLLYHSIVSPAITTSIGPPPAKSVPPMATLSQHASV